MLYDSGVILIISTLCFVIMQWCHLHKSKTDYLPLPSTQILFTLLLLLVYPDGIRRVCSSEGRGRGRGGGGGGAIPYFNANE